MNKYCCTADANGTEKYFFDPTTRTCTQITATGPSEMNVYSGDVKTCVDNTFYPTAGFCCGEGSLVTNGACAAAATATNCAKFKAADLDDYSNCTECKANFSLINSTTQTCEALTTVGAKYIGAAAYKEIPAVNYNKCTQKDSTNTCILCDETTHYLLAEACVSYTKKWTGDPAYSEAALADANCKKGSQTVDGECELCSAGFTLTDATTCTA